MTRRVVAFLQNAYSLEPALAGTSSWHRRSWLRAMHGSHTGRRLRVLVARCPDVEIWWDNTTPAVGDRAGSRLRPDLGYMLGVLKRRRPELVVALGKQARWAAPTVWDGPLLCMPHPAWRHMTDALLARAGEHIRRGFAGQLNLFGPCEEVEVC